MSEVENSRILDYLGVFFPVYPLIIEAYKYIIKKKKADQIEEQLIRVLASPLRSINEGLDNSSKSGKKLVSRFHSLVTSPTKDKVEDFLEISCSFCRDFEHALGGILKFGQACNQLTSGGFDAFVENVKQYKPNVHDVLSSFGRNYDRRTNTINLSFLPTLVRLYIPEIKWKNGGNLTKVKEEIEIVDKYKREVAAILSSGMYRKPFHKYRRSLGDLLRVARRFYVEKSLLSELQVMSPEWYRKLMATIDELGK
jgi:hypothetical protein